MRFAAEMSIPFFVRIQTTLYGCFGIARRGSVATFFYWYLALLTDIWHLWVFASFFVYIHVRWEDLDCMVW